jgi:hypothetical protein
MQSPALETVDDEGGLRRTVFSKDSQLLGILAL